MISNNLRKLKSFTLIETLLVLMIISVIATITITSLNNNVSKTEAVAKINVAHSLLSRALIFYQAENFCSGDLSSCNDFISEYPNVENVYDSIFGSQLKTQQNCGILANLGCFAKTYSSENNPYLSIDGLNDYYKVRLQNGISFAISIPHGGCQNNVCANIIIDTNGPLPPNKLNNDLFEGQITKNQVVFDF